MPAAEKICQSPVLVVEDEFLVRIVLVEELEEAGFHVIEAETGDEALREMERTSGLRALLTDVEMPGTMNGLALAKITSERYPDAAVVIVSGRMRPGTSDLPPKAKFFAKPYKHADLIATLHDMMRGEES